jgi:hypothetical protein
MRRLHPECVDRGWVDKKLTTVTRGVSHIKYFHDLGPSASEWQ